MIGWRDGMRALGLGLVLLGLVLSAQASAAELLMFRRAGCPWCAKWDQAIAPVYPQTEEAKRAPLRMVDLDHARAPEESLARPVRYTPTFVLVDHDREVGRIEGYPGEEFFWGLLDELIAKLPSQKPHVTLAEDIVRR
jgi:thioredoxin-related protein